MSHDLGQYVKHDIISRVEEMWLGKARQPKGYDLQSTVVQVPVTITSQSPRLTLEKTEARMLELGLG